jgi:hypothetical protein
MQDVYVYLKVNRLTYDNNEKKISFILSYLAKGDSAVWKQQFIQTRIEESKEAKSDQPNWGTYKEFVEALKRTFQPYDELAEALELGNATLGPTKPNYPIRTPTKDT